MEPTTRPDMTNKFQFQKFIFLILRITVIISTFLKTN